MRKRVRALGPLVAAAGLGTVLLSGTAGAAGGGRPFRLDLSGANEFNDAGVPINPHGDADRGSITLRLNHGQGEVCWSVGELTLTAGDALPSAGHIHEAPTGVAGPIVVPLFGASVAAPTDYPTATSCVSADRDLVKAITKQPSDYYVNLHNAQHPGGVVRAQLEK